jgi:hypothetical protein
LLSEDDASAFRYYATSWASWVEECRSGQIEPRTLPAMPEPGLRPLLGSIRVRRAFPYDTLPGIRHCILGYQRAHVDHGREAHDSIDFDAFTDWLKTQVRPLPRRGTYRWDQLILFVSYNAYHAANRFFDFLEAYLAATGSSSPGL